VRLVRFVALAAFAGGTAACAMVAGLPDYTLGSGESGGGKPPLKDARVDAPVVVTDDEGGGSEAGDTDDGPGNDGSGDATEDTGDGMAGSDGMAGARDVGAPETGTGGPDGGPDGNDGGLPETGPPHDGGDGGCTALTHLNGVGGTYKSCAAPNTYDLAEATKACASASSSSCSMQAIICGINDNENFVCGTTGPGSACTCWSYQSPNPGHVRVTTLAPNLCQCATGADLAWF
jgi:hypothetical protein